MAGADVLQRVDADPDHALLHGEDGDLNQAALLAAAGAAAEDEGVELVDARLGLGDRDQGGRRAIDRAGALTDELGDDLGVVQPAVVEHGDTEIAHDRGPPLRPRRRPAPR